MKVRVPDSGWTVRVPGSTSNLGAGFDVLGMAVDRELVVRMRPSSEAKFRLVRAGTLAEIEDDRPAHDLVVRTILDHLPDLLDRPLLVEADSQLPIGRGLGSSAAARVAGEILGRLLRGEVVDRDEVAASATEGEGHPDNVVPSVFGGLRACGTIEGRPDHHLLPISPRIGWGYAAPGTQLATEVARKVLPEAWERGVVVRSLSRLGRLIPALAEPGPEGVRLRGLLDDELHVPHRLQLVPGGTAAVRAAREAGAWGVTLSGAGTGLLVLGAPERIPALVEAMIQGFAEAGGGEPVGFPLAPRPEGAIWGVSPSAPSA